MGFSSKKKLNPETFKKLSRRLKSKTDMEKSSKVWLIILFAAAVYLLMAYT